MDRSLALLNATADSLPEREVLRLALQEAVAEGGGLGGPAWFPMPEGPGPGMASVPLRKARGEPFGALTVVTATPGEPTAGQRDVLRAAAEWAAGRLRPAEPSRAGSETPPGVAGVPDTPGAAGLRRGFGGTRGGGPGLVNGPGVLHPRQPPAS